MNCPPKPSTFSAERVEIRTYSITELREGMCACLVPVEPYPRYCGQPVTRNFRMCKWHGAAYLVEKKR